jgi:hypothetical protein
MSTVLSCVSGFVCLVAEALFICLVQGAVLSLFISLKKQLAGDDAVSADEQVTLSAVFAHLLHGAC